MYQNYPTGVEKGKKSPLKQAIEGLMNVVRKCMKMEMIGNTINKACVEPREKQAKGDAEF